MKIKAKKRNPTKKEALDFLVRALKDCREEIKVEKEKAAMGRASKREEKKKRAQRKGLSHTAYQTEQVRNQVEIMTNLTSS